MSDKDIAKIKDLIYDIKDRVNSKKDDGVRGQYATYEYAVNSPDIKLWAEQTDVFKLLLDDLTKEEVKLGDFIESTLKYVDIMENYIHDQEIINRNGSL